MTSTSHCNSTKPTVPEARENRNRTQALRWGAGCLLAGWMLSSCGSGELDTPQGAADNEPARPAQGTQASPAARQVPKPPAQPKLVGYHLAGRVVDPWNDGVAGAAVRAVAAGEEEEGETLAQATSDKSGAYQLELPGPGPFELFARHSQGFDLLTSTPLEEGVLNQAKAFHLAGEGRLGGRVLDAEGQPVADTFITAFHRDLLHEILLGGHESFSVDTYPLTAPSLEDAYFQPGLGFQHKVATTNEQGRFYFKGLVPGDYLFYCSALGLGPWRSTTREWTKTSAVDLELRSTICLLEVGVGLDGLPGSITGKESNPRRLGPVEVFPSVLTEFGPRPLLGRAASPYGGERNVFALEPGYYFVRATTYPPQGAMGGTMHAEGHIELKAGEALRRVDLVFPAVDRPTGRLRVSAEIPEGWQTPRRFHLLTAETSQELECSEFTPYPKMQFDEWLEVPEGEYVIALLPFEDFVGQPEVIDIAPCYRRVKIQGGEDVESTLRAVPGGRMRVAVDGDRFVLGEHIVFPEDMLDGDVRALMSLFEETIGAVITVVRDDDGPALKLRLRDRLNRLTPERRSMLPGEVMENFVPMEPGTYRVWAQAPGYPAASGLVVIRSGETTDVSIQLATPK